MRDRTHEAVGNVDVVSGYAIAGWVGNGGGADAFAQGKDGTWRRIGGGGGMIDAGYLVEKGVPKATAERLIKIHSGCV